jgi:hypothetical protein
VALALCWPAIWNGFPLLFSDSLEYLGRGHAIFAVLRSLHTGHLQFLFDRSEIYSSSLIFLHHAAFLWPIVAVQALLTASVLWLVIRTCVPRNPLVYYFAISLVLAISSGVAWYVSFVMPDIFGPILYLAFFLLIAAPESLQASEAVLLCALFFFSATAHATHLLVSAGLCALFAGAWAVGWLGMKGRGRGVLLVTGLTLLAALAQVAVHARLYGQPSLFGNPPPFLMARLLGDGPAFDYLEQHCNEFGGAICEHAGNLPQTAEDFLWKPDGIWHTASEEQQDQLRRQQLPLLLATLRYAPGRQAKISARNFFEMLVTLGPADFSRQNTFLPGNMDWAASGLSDRFEASLQARDAMPQALFRKLQAATTLVSVLLIAFALPLIAEQRLQVLSCLAAVVIFAVLANAFLSGVVSCIDPRLQGRVSWLLVLLAALLAEPMATLSAQHLRKRRSEG